MDSGHNDRRSYFDLSKLPLRFRTSRDGCMNIEKASTTCRLFIYKVGVNIIKRIKFAVLTEIQEFQ